MSAEHMTLKSWLAEIKTRRKKGHPLLVADKALDNPHFGFIDLEDESHHFVTTDNARDELNVLDPKLRVFFKTAEGRRKILA